MSIRRPRIRRIHATVLIDLPCDSATRDRADECVFATLRALTTDDALRLARHLGYQRRAEQVQVWVRVRTKRKTKRGVGAKDIRTCARYSYRRNGSSSGTKLVLTERCRVSRTAVPQRPKENSR